MVNVEGVKAHTHTERLAVANSLIPLLQKKFGKDLIAVAVSASVAREQDCPYSDLELDVFVGRKPSEQEDQYLQRVVDGMLVEALYHTPDDYTKDRTTVTAHWHISASDRLVALYNAPFIDSLMAGIRSVAQPKEVFIRAATRERYDLHESFTKVFNAIDERNAQGISLLVMDAVLNTLHVLALLNQHPFTTFSRYIAEARLFSVKPQHLDDLLNILVQGSYWELNHLKEVTWSIFGEMEAIFAEYGIHLYGDVVDPNQPNHPYLDMQV